MYQLTKILLVASLTACGSGETVIVEKEVPVENPNPAEPKPGGRVPGGEPIAYPQMQALLNKNCGQCHASAAFMSSEVALRNSRVKDELTGRSMPPDADALSEGERTLMVNFFL